jgi:UDP-glucose 4-epimerase
MTLYRRKDGAMAFQKEYAIGGKSVIVTGGCGFIGSHLVAALLRREARKVIVIDSLRCGDRANLAGLGDRVVCVRHELGSGDSEELHPYFESADYLFHLAAEKHQSKEHPTRVLRANIEGTYQVLELAARHGLKKAVFTSSLYSYGRMSAPATREDDPLLPTTVYGISKLAGERLFQHFAAAHGLRSNTLRYYFVYGPRQFAGMGYKSVIVRNFERILQNSPPVIFGDGLQALDYVYVDDAVEATLLALESPVCGEAFNVSTGNAVSVRELTEAMLAAARSTLAPVHEPPDWTADSWRAGDATKIERLVGWRPRTPLRAGLTKVYDWMRTHEEN